jgi:sugar phosphate isomerase/epimerase
MNEATEITRDERGAPRHRPQRMASTPMIKLTLLSFLLLSRPAAGNEFFAMDNALGDVNTLDGKAGLLSELGYDGVTWRPGNTAEAVRAMSAKSIRMHALMMNLAVSKEEQTALLPLADIQALKDSGAVLWVQLIGKGGDDSDAVRELRRLNAVAKPLGLRVAIYPHVNNHVESLEDALRVAGLVADDNVGVSLTLCHQLKVRGMQDLKPLIQKALPELFLVLVSGADSGNTRAMGWDRLIQPLGHGSYDVAALIGTLRELGYKGPVGVIGYGLKQPAKEHLRQSIGFWRQTTASTGRP